MASKTFMSSSWGSVNYCANDCFHCWLRYNMTTWIRRTVFSLQTTRRSRGWCLDFICRVNHHKQFVSSIADIFVILAQNDNVSFFSIPLSNVWHFYYVSMINVSPFITSLGKTFKLVYCLLSPTVSIFIPAVTLLGISYVKSWYETSPRAHTHQKGIFPHAR